MSYFDIEDYFIEIDSSGLHERDLTKIRNLRDDINSFRKVSEQVEFINDRRKNASEKRFDQRIFDIPRNAILHPSKYKSSSIENQRNEHWNGMEKAQLYSELVGKAGTAKALIAKLFVPTLVLLGLFILLNLTLYVAGIVNTQGSTPFLFCKDGGASSSFNAGGDRPKEKDGYKIPVDYVTAGANGYNGQEWDGDDNLRGIGVFASEDFRFGGDDSFSKENYAISARWEYVTYTVGYNMWPSHGPHGNGSTDGVDISYPYQNYDSGHHNWILNQRVMVFNPDNGKGVVTMVGNGEDNANWGGSPLETVGGLSYKAQEALGFKAGGLDGGDYDTNSRDSGIEMEMWWVDEDTPLGPAENIVLGNRSQCGGSSNLGGGNETIADAAVSLADESIEISTPNSRPNGGNGSDLYISVHDQVLPGDPWYQSCDRFLSTVVRWSGADDDFPPGPSREIMRYLAGSEKWERIPAKSENDLEPGDVIVGPTHSIVYTGNEAVKKRFPDSTGVIAHASIGSASSPEQQTSSSISDNRPGAIGNWYNMGLKENGGQFEVYRNIKSEEVSVFKDVN